MARGVRGLSHTRGNFLDIITFCKQNTAILIVVRENFSRTTYDQRCSLRSLQSFVVNVGNFLPFTCPLTVEGPRLVPGGGGGGGWEHPYERGGDARMKS